ncbi:hypothetical protein NDU88_001141 [Pleurodeles waltl]|uniref:Uncharacterized protein n=1 Tax=Pleurodeles waltl TaxID=8319 RepID=A0AAV7SA05_PLEWA|nr:hypothetical protein NDU88_001141 [Pleurodeles waltl]
MTDVGCPHLFENPHLVSKKDKSLVRDCFLEHRRAAQETNEVVKSDPHSDRACADTTPHIPEVTRGDGLPIGSRTPPRELKVVKKRLPPFHGESNGCWSWCTKESTGDEERKPKEDAGPEDTALRMSGPTLGSRTAEIQCRGEDCWPRGAHE